MVEFDEGYTIEDGIDEVDSIADEIYDITKQLVDVAESLARRGEPRTRKYMYVARKGNAFLDELLKL